MIRDHCRRKSAICLYLICPTLIGLAYADVSMAGRFESMFATQVKEPRESDADALNYANKIINHDVTEVGWEGTTRFRTRYTFVINSSGQVKYVETSPDLVESSYTGQLRQTGFRRLAWYIADVDLNLLRSDYMDPTRDVVMYLMIKRSNKTKVIRFSHSNAPPRLSAFVELLNKEFLSAKWDDVGAQEKVSRMLQ